MKIIGAGPFTAGVHIRLADLIGGIFLNSSWHQTAIITFITGIETKENTLGVNEMIDKTELC